MFGDYIGAAGATGVERFDIVLVDGRCRGECAIAVLPFVDERSFVRVLTSKYQQLFHAPIYLTEKHMKE